jgi:uncharacterized protein (TIGR00369 family)
MEFEEGGFVFQGRPSARFLNPLGTIHGGWISTMLDSAVGCAIHTTLPAGKGYSTVELKVSFLRPLTPAIRLVRAEGRVLNTGTRAAFAEAHLRGPTESSTRTQRQPASSSKSKGPLIHESLDRCVRALAFPLCQEGSPRCRPAG